MIELSENELVLSEKLVRLKNASGTHSPSVQTLLKELGISKVGIDACFLSNPYATELFMRYLNRDLLATGGLRNRLEYYPSQNRILAARLSKPLDIDPNTIFVGNGAIEIIQAMLHRFGGPRVMVNLPTFSSYYEFAAENQEVFFYKFKKENDFKLEADDYIAAVEKIRPDTVVIINPNNPDGGYIKRSVLEKILCSIGWVKNVIIDESFIHFAYEEESNDIPYHQKLISKYNNITVVKSMSKDFGLAGIRLGYAVMSPDRVSLLLKNGYLWNSNGLAEYFVELLEDSTFQDEYEKARIGYLRSSERFFSSLRQLPRVKVYSSMANFSLIELEDGVKAEIVTSKLLFSHGVYVRNCGDKIGLDGEFLRVAARTENENNAIFEALNSVLGH